MRLVDIDSLKGCAIIRPTSSEEIAHIQACKGLISHKDIPTAYDVEAKVAELENFEMWKELLIYDLSHREREIIEKAISIVRRKE